MGTFKVDTFKKWKSQLQQINQTSNKEIKDLFNALDPTKKGFINIHLIRERQDVLRRKIIDQKVIEKIMKINHIKITFAS